MTLRGHLLIVFAVSAPARHALADSCTPAALGVPKATVLKTWDPPYTCHPTVTAKTIIHTQAELTAAFKCDPGVAPALDFKAQSVVIVPWSMSPAATALDGLDDGKLLTLVTKYRHNCPGDPQAMPAPGLAYFLIPAAGAKRSYADAHCDLQNTCKK
jgi:hypothetical protein